MSERVPCVVTTQDGLQLHVHRWEVDDARGTVLVVHGLGEHGGRYAEIAAELNRRGFRVVAPDLRGHGRSEGPATDTPQFDCFLDDVERVEREMCDDAFPLALWGHSMGGLITLRYLQTRGTRARFAVVSAPWLGRSPSAPWWKTTAGRMIGMFRPSAPLPSGVQGWMVTHDEQKQAEYDGDPLVRKTVSPRLFSEGSRAVDRAFEEIDRLTADCLFLVPLADRLVNAPETLRFSGMLPAERCTVWSSEEWRHEPHNEMNRGVLLERVGDWLESKLTE